VVEVGAVAGLVAGVEFVVTAWLIAVVSVCIPSNCSSWLYWVNCVTNWLLSTGLSGSWFCNWETRSVRNVDSLASGSLVAVLLAELVCEAEVPVEASGLAIVLINSP
jgi:hypothetical protein